MGEKEAEAIHLTGVKWLESSPVDGRWSEGMTLGHLWRWRGGWFDSFVGFAPAPERDEVGDGVRRLPSSITAWVAQATRKSRHPLPPSPHTHTHTHPHYPTQLFSGSKCNTSFFFFFLVCGCWCGANIRRCFIDSWGREGGRTGHHRSNVSIRWWIKLPAIEKPAGNMQMIWRVSSIADEISRYSSHSQVYNFDIGWEKVGRYLAAIFDGFMLIQLDWFLSGSQASWQSIILIICKLFHSSGALCCWCCDGAGHFLPPPSLPPSLSLSLSLSLFATIATFNEGWRTPDGWSMALRANGVLLCKWSHAWSHPRIGRGEKS